jgi:hypothetical protein
MRAEHDDRVRYRATTHSLEHGLEEQELLDPTEARRGPRSEHNDDNGRMTHLGDHYQLPPEPGFARREAHRREESRRVTETFGGS